MSSFDAFLCSVRTEVQLPQMFTQGVHTEAAYQDCDGDQQMLREERQNCWKPNLT